MRARSVIGVGVALATLVARVASAQHNTTSASLAAEPYSIETFGVFRDLMLQGDFTSKVAIGLVMSRLPSTGVGAVSGARGEITIADGKLIISYGKSGAPPASDTETAALLATGKVKEWQSVRVDSDVAPPTVEAFLAQSAKAHGLNPEQSFPLQLRGTVAPYIKHVNAAPIDGQQVKHRQDNIDDQCVLEILCDPWCCRFWQVIDEVKGECGENGERNVHGRPSRSYPDHVASGVAECSEIHRHRLGITEHKR